MQNCLIWIEMDGRRRDGERERSPPLSRVLPPPLSRVPPPCLASPAPGRRAPQAAAEPEGGRADAETGGRADAGRGRRGPAGVSAGAYPGPSPPACFSSPIKSPPLSLCVLFFPL